MYGMKETYTSTKHGKQAVIVIPKILESELKPGTITEVRITVFKEAEP